jgi:hypothetical protein
VFNYETQNGALLHDLNFESGLLKLDVSSTLKHDITLKITFPDLKLSGNIVSKTINLIYSNSLPQTGSGTIDLSNVLADFTAGGTADNTLRINIDAKITSHSINFKGNANSPLAFDLLNGLSNGQNLTWNISFGGKAAGNIQINISYEGRKTQVYKTVHIGRAEARYIF